MNEEQYAKALQELVLLQGIDWETDLAANENAEYIVYRIQVLRADIIAYEHSLLAIYNPIDEVCGDAL